MGKRLIINGANFYENRIEDVVLTPVDITDLFVITRGRLPWLKEQKANTRAGNILANGVDISTYLAYGYTGIKVTRFSLSWVAKANQDTTTLRNDMNDCVYAPDATGQTWATTDYQGTLNANYPYLYIGLLGSSDFPATINLRDYVKIELLPPSL